MRKKKNPQLKDAEHQIKILSRSVDLSDDAIITISLNGIITSWNRGAELIFGYSAEEVLGMSLSILDPPFLVGETIELNELIKHEEKIHHYETLRLRKDGKIINVSLTLSSILDNFGNLAEILVIARDITKSKQAEEKLRRSEEIYRFNLEQTGQLMYDYDLRTDKCRWAGAIEEVTGYSLEEFQTFGKYIWNTIIQPLNMDRIHIKPQNKGKTGDRYKEELRLRRKDGTSICVENKGVYLKDNEGNPYEVLGVIKNITDLKAAVKKVEKSEDKYRSFVKNFHGIIYQRNEKLVVSLSY